MFSAKSFESGGDGIDDGLTRLRSMEVHDLGHSMKGDVESG